MTSDPDFTVVQWGRYDDDSNDWPYRQQMSLQSFLWSSNFAGTTMEVIVVDWGSKRPVRETLVQDAPEDSIRWMKVPREIAGDALHPQDEAKAWNVGLRRAKGKYVMWVCGDTLMLPECWWALAKCIHDNEEYEPSYYLPKLCFPQGLVDQQPALTTLMGMASDWVMRGQGIQGHDIRCFFGGSSGYCLRKDVWHEIRGISEHEFGYDNDLGCRVAPYYPPVNVGNHGCWPIHLDHAIRDKPGREPWKPPAELVVNDENWGLPQLEVE